MKQEKRPTVIDIARETGLSCTTVQCVLGGRRLERFPKATRNRVLEAAKRLGYVRNYHATALKLGYSNSLVLVSDDWDMAASHVITTMRMSEVARRHELHFVIEVAPGEQEARDLLDKVWSYSPYGLAILWEHSLPTDKLLNIQKHGLPVVNLLPSNYSEIVSVTSDREHGFFILTQHLVDLGHTRIGIITGAVDVFKTSELKLGGYKKALAANGIEFDARLALEVESGESFFDVGYAGFRRLWERNPDMTAIVSLNDPIAIGTAVAAQDVGLTVPNNMSVGGYGDHREATAVRPALTSVAVTEGVAEATIDMLVKMRTEPDFKAESVYVPMELVVRSSTGPAPKR